MEWRQKALEYRPFQSGASIKMTNAVCNSYNKSWVVITQCRLKALQRNKTILNVDMDFIHPVNDIDVRIQILRKGNGYKPWLFDISFDGCKFMRRPNNPAVKTIFSIFKEYTTINHTCPYDPTEA
ncbi:uncharacterized protein Dmoj_GI23047 [Drosophila mojavensis]|uniref:Uncharacterized protein n=1 Tax=Drosophila mojavensis TaxID=7230 RepID=B4KDT6_DROMO|nr:uncharacterized protein Dmoj_GI23047 [Drosophila mojavensis]